jgi:hypothetical protein
VSRLDFYDDGAYRDPVDPDLAYPSVSEVLNATTPKPWLTAWAAKVAAEFVVDNLDTVTTVSRDVGRAAAVDLIKGESRRRRETKADIGSQQHAVLEALLTDAPIPPLPDNLVDVEIDGDTVDHDAISDGLINFLTDFGVEVVLAEATVCSVAHGYAGTLDLIADFPGLQLPKRPAVEGRPVRLMVDCKTGVSLGSEVIAQLVAYERADEVWIDRLGNKVRMPEVDGLAVLRVRREYDRGYKLLLLPGDLATEAFAWALQSLAILRQRKRFDRLRWTPLYPPRPDGTQPAPRLEDLDPDSAVGRAVKPLRAIGAYTVDDVAMMTAAEVKAVKGVGPKMFTALSALLADHGLDWAAP